MRNVYYRCHAIHAPVYTFTYTRTHTHLWMSSRDKFFTVRNWTSLSVLFSSFFWMENFFYCRWCYTWFQYIWLVKYKIGYYYSIVWFSSFQFLCLFTLNFKLDLLCLTMVSSNIYFDLKYISSSTATIPKKKTNLKIKSFTFTKQILCYIFI